MKQISWVLLLVPALALAAEPESSTITKLRARAEQGVAGAQYNLAEMYAGGYGVPKDPVMAVAWYRKAAEQGFGDAQFSLAMACLNGEGVRKDEIEGLAWVTVAAQTGGTRLVKFRDQLIRQLGPEGAAAAHKRSQELLQAMEARKRAKAEGR